MSSTTEQQLRVGFIGLGAMGTRMAANVAAGGLELTVFNRTAAAAEAFVREHPAELAATPRALAERCEVIVSMVSDLDAVEALYDGPDGVLAGLRSGAVAVEMSTIGPAGARALAARVEGAGAALVDGPVSGSVGPAERGELTILAGGSAAALERARPALEAIGEPILHLGDVGAGQVVKLAINAVIYGLNEALSEALVLAERAGIERGAAYEAFAQSAIAAPVVHYRREAFERPGEVPVSFRLALADKDLRLALELAGEVDSELPQARRNLEIIGAAIAAGYGDRDLADVAEFLRHDPPRTAEAAGR